MAVVELLLSPLPSHVRTARLVVVAAARRAGLDDERVDELRLALGEACSRAVVLHAVHAPDQPVRVTVQDDPGRLTVTVTDRGPSAGPVSDDVAGVLLGDDGDGTDAEGAGTDDGGRRQDPALDGGPSAGVDPHVALAVVTGLVDDVEVGPGPAPDGAGTAVVMRWPLPPPPVAASA